MERRHFLAASLATSVAAIAGSAGAQAPANREREFYLLRRYSLQTGPQTKLTEDYFQGSPHSGVDANGNGTNRRVSC